MPRPLLPSELEHSTLPDDGTSISARVRADLAEEREPVDLTQAERLAVRVLRSEGVSIDEGRILARAVLRQGTLLDEYEARLAELEVTP